jgi:hypothetical protein
MKFGPFDGSIWKPDTCIAFDFPPSAFSELPAELHDITNPASYSNRLDIFDFSDYVYAHKESYFKENLQARCSYAR